MTPPSPSDPAVPVILVDIADHVATLTLNRPERMNAYTTQMGIELNQALADLDANDDVRAIVVTGAGRAFCAGADLGSGGETFDRDEADVEKDRTEASNRPRFAPWEIRKPIIAAINGHAVGVGITIPLQYDMRIVAEDAKLGFVFARRGILPELASTWILPRLIGIARACDLMLTGRIFSGREAAELGYANEAVPKDRVLPRAMEIARDIATNVAPVSAALTKRLLWEHLACPTPEQASERETAGLWPLGRSADAKEGVTSFLEKRDPQWSLRVTTDMPDIPELKTR